MEDKAQGDAWKALVDAYAAAQKTLQTQRNPNFGGVIATLENFSKTFRGKEEQLKSLAAGYGFPRTISATDKAKLLGKLKDECSSGSRRGLVKLLETTLTIATAELAAAPVAKANDPIDKALENFENFRVADINNFLETNKDNKTAMQKLNAKFAANPKAIQALLRAEPEKIIDMMKWNSSVMNGAIIDKGLDQAALFKACEKGESENIEFLLGNNPRLLMYRNSEGMSPLSVASAHGQLAVVELLVKMSDVNSRDNHGLTPFMHGCKAGHVDVAKILIETNLIDINAEDRNNHRPLDYACMSGKADTVKLLLASGAEVTQKAFDSARALRASNPKASGDISTLLTEEVITRRKPAPLVKPKYETGLAENERAVLKHEVQELFSRLDHTTDLKEPIKNFFDKIPRQHKIFALDVMISTGSPAVINAIVDNQQAFFSREVYGKQFNKATYLMHTETLEKKLIEHQQQQKGLQQPEQVTSHRSVQPSTSARVLPQNLTVFKKH